MKEQLNYDHDPTNVIGVIEGEEFEGIKKFLNMPGVRESLRGQKDILSQDEIDVIFNHGRNKGFTNGSIVKFKNRLTGLDTTGIIDGYLAGKNLYHVRVVDANGRSRYVYQIAPSEVELIKSWPLREKCEVAKEEPKVLTEYDIYRNSLMRGTNTTMMSMCDCGGKHSASADSRAAHATWCKWVKSL
jgi:hypothetical protein